MVSFCTLLVHKYRTFKFDRINARYIALGNGDEERIVGGVEVRPKFKYPFVVRIWFKNSSAGKTATQCGGTILNRNWILTAAHCVNTVIVGMVITAGDHSVHETEVNEQDVSVKQVILHEKYR